MSEERDGRLEIRDALDSEWGAVREVTLAAYGEYARIMEPSAWEGLSGAVAAALESPLEVQRIVAVRDGEIIASVMLFPPAADVYRGAAQAVPWPELRLLAVAPAARGSGVGQSLIEEVVRRARAAGATHLGLHTSRSMEPAVRIYERMGFIRDAANDFHPDGAELVLAYRLTL